MGSDENITTFILDGFGKASRLDYLYFVCALLLYLITLSTNLLLIAVIVLKKSLHEPMYIFLCNLAVNELYGSSTLLPKLMFDLLSEKKMISRIGCYVQVFCVHIFICNEVTILTVMACDRYVAICNPLRYATIMTKAKICKLLLVALLYSVFLHVIVVGLTGRLPLCGSTIQKLYCDNMSVVKLSCVDTSVNNLFGIIMVALTVIIPLTVIMYSYMQISIICLKTSKEARGKLFHTCVTHLLTFFCFLIGGLFVIIQHRLNAETVPYSVHVFMSLEFLTVTPLFNPVIYGVRTENIRTEIIKLFRTRTKPLIKNQN
ncbi:olfactory receptor 4C12-like [Latimeria chalumnae]|uniref:olfactory receptor 4C12-like n=1 Tax=Latimeria chalumnae TaxID=7897 RepID=UPI0003C16263